VEQLARTATAAAAARVRERFFMAGFSVVMG